MHRMALCGIWMACASVGWAEDWSEWRGPDRSGVLRESVPLLDAVPTNGLKLLWQVEMPGEREGNYSSPVAANGKAYVHVSWAKKEDIPTRRVDKNLLKQFGAIPKDMPEALLQKIETARVSDERKNQTRQALREWTRLWVTNSLTAEEYPKYQAFASDRLSRGAEAMSVPACRQLEALGEKTFESQDKLVEWMTGAKFTDADKALLDKAVPKQRPYREDVLVCVDIARGTVVWKKEFPTANAGNGASNTPCVRDGKVFFGGCNGTVYCLNAETGEEVWKVPDPAKGESCDSSILVADGKVILQTRKGTVALDAATGKEVWRNTQAAADSNSPSRWEHEGKTYVIAAGPQFVCVDAADGKTVWSVPGTKWTTPAVSGDTMAVMVSEKEAVVYKLAPDGATKVTSREFKFRSCSPATDGKRVYALACRTGVCFDAATGQVLWENAGNNDTYSSPIVADGKILCNHRNGFILYDAATGKELGKAGIQFAECTTAGLADGRILARTKTHLTCYDLRKN